MSCTAAALVARMSPSRPIRHRHKIKVAPASSFGSPEPLLLFPCSRVRARRPAVASGPARISWPVSGMQSLNIIGSQRAVNAAQHLACCEGPCSLHDAARRYAQDGPRRRTGRPTAHRALSRQPLPRAVAEGMSRHGRAPPPAAAISNSDAAAGARGRAAGPRHRPTSVAVVSARSSSRCRAFQSQRSRRRNRAERADVASRAWGAGFEAVPTRSSAAAVSETSVGTGRSGERRVRSSWGSPSSE